MAIGRAYRRDSAPRAASIAAVNFARDVVEAAPPQARALVELARDGTRREWTFAEVAAGARAAAAGFRQAGLRRGDVVLTLVGNRPEWVRAMVACFRLGLVALPANEQLRAGDLQHRIAVAGPRAVVCDPRNAAVLAAAGWDGPVLWPPYPPGEVPPPADLAPEDPCLITFTSGTAGPPKAVLHAQRYLGGQMLQARHWLDARAGDLVWCTAASGWSKSARNVFVAPWLRGAAALLHDARFDPHERLDLIERERVDLLCMAPTEYRVLARRTTLPRLDSLRAAVAAGEALDATTLGAWHEATGLWVRDGYGQTETGQLTGMPLGIAAVPGSMGVPLPGVRLDVDDGELVVDPATVPTFFARYLGEEPHAGVWRTGDRVERDARRLPALRRPHRRRDRVRRLPDRPVRGRVRARLARRGRRGGGGRGARRGARQRGPRGRGAARRVRALGQPRRRAAGPRQGPHRALQVPAPGRVRGRAPEDVQRQDPPGRLKDGGPAGVILGGPCVFCLWGWRKSGGSSRVPPRGRRSRFHPLRGLRAAVHGVIRTMRQAAWRNLGDPLAG